MNREIEDYELRVYGISNTIGLEKDVVNMSDDEWVDLAEQFGYISTLNTFIDNVNNGVVAKDYPHLKFKVIAIGKYKKETTEEIVVDIIPTNKLHYIIRDKE